MSQGVYCTSQAGVVQHVQHSSSVCVRSGVGAGLARWLLRAGSDDGRLRWDVWPGNSVRQGSGLLKADGSWGGGTRDQQRQQYCSTTCQ